MAAVRSVAAVAWVEEAPWVPPVGADAGEGVAGPASGEAPEWAWRRGQPRSWQMPPTRGRLGSDGPRGVGDPGLRLVGSQRWFAWRRRSGKGVRG